MTSVPPQNSKIFWGGGTAASPSGRGTPPPAPTLLGACGASIFALALTHASPHSEVWLRACL